MIAERVVIAITELEKRRVKLYNRLIPSVAMDISQSHYWRQLLFASDYDQKFLINSNSQFHFPNNPSKIFIDHNLQFYVSKVLECPEMFDEICIIFKFESLEFPQITQYSGNYNGVKLQDLL